MRLNRSIIVLLLAMPFAAGAERAVPSAGDARHEEPSLDTIIRNHVAALGGEKLLRGGKSFTFTVSGEKKGKAYTKKVVQARPNKMRVDITSDEGTYSRGFDGKVAWVKKPDAKAEAMSAEETASMAKYASFEEPLVDYVKKGTSVKLVGKTEVKGAAAYDLEVTFKSGDVEHHFLDASSFLLVQRTMPGKDKDGKAVTHTVRFGDYKKVQGRMINHSVEWDHEGTAHKSVVSAVKFDVKVDAKLFAMPK